MARRYAETDRSGSHPFQDDGVDLPTPVENESPAAPQYTPQGYEKNQVSLGNTVLSLGIVSLFVLALTAMLYVIYSPFVPRFIFILNWTTSLPAFFLGRSELKAIRTGVVASEQRARTHLGLWLGLAISLASCLLVFQSVFSALWRMWWSWL